MQNDILHAHEHEIELARRGGWDAGVAAGENRAGYDREDAEKLKNAVSEFQKASGVSISHWNAGQVGDAVRAIMNKTHLRGRDNLRQALESVERVQKALKAELESL